MAHYLIRATPRDDALAELRAKLDDDAFIDMEPFGRALTDSLERARWDADRGEAVWEETDFCSPPLRQERDAVLDTYFSDIRVERVEDGAGWDRIDDLPRLWDVR